jgi:hypothetical protein
MDARRQQAQRLDQWLETGRQLVDGVAGTRPGRRGGGTRPGVSRAGRTASAGLDAVGRWVGDKIDWLLEEDEDWREPWQDQDPRPQARIGGKRPLQAISRRQPAAIAPASEPQALQPAAPSDDDWPEERDFRVERWQRGVDRAQPRQEPPAVSRRSLPRSSRRRD